METATMAEDYKAMQAKALEQLRSGQSLTGKDGAFAQLQSRVVHQIRNSFKYVASKDQKTFLKDLKCVYQAPNKIQTEDELLKLDEI